MQFIRIKMVRENQRLFKRFDRKLLSVKDVTAVAEIYFKETDREEVVTFCLDTKNRLTAINQVSVGSLNQSVVHPREVFKSAILANSAAIILAHNHPSGDPSPSSEDDVITKKILQAGKILGIHLLDHVIIADKRHFSYQENKWNGLNQGIEVS
jgi:DNA repair protein RadC